MQRKRILIADDHELILTGISTLIPEHFLLVGEAKDGRELVSKARYLFPDIIILDIGMPLLNGIEAARQIIQFLPQAKLIFLTQQLDPNYIQQALRAGAKGFVAKQAASTELLEAVNAVLQDHFYVSPLAMHKVPEAGLDPRKNPVELFENRLTPRQREVLQLIAEGKSAKEVAALLNITTKTADFHKGCIMDELGLRTTAELTRYAIAHGLVQLITDDLAG